MQYGVSNGEVVAALTPQGNWRADNDITKGTDRSAVESEYGQPETFIVKGNTRYRITNENKGLYNIDGNYVTFYYDSHTENTISSVFAIDQAVEDAYDQYYPDSTGHVRDLFEEELFALVNAMRVGHELGVLENHVGAAETALAHSRDMASNQYFSHYDPNGVGPFDRMENNSIEFRSAAENLARGQVVPIDVVEGWMNSEHGHREAMLGHYTHTGIGIAFDEENANRPYFTQLYFTRPN
ncbi:transporter [Geomicrobium sp. JCM 19039]|nr:transporter [Geomicrobium sp. JCM 19039]